MGSRPKILTAVTVPSGGWDIDFTISDGVSPQALTATISAGTYFVAWDAQSDDLLFEVATQMRAAIVGGGLGASRGVYVSLNEAHKVEIHFIGANFAGSPNNEVELNWTTSNADLIKALGVDGTADDTSTGTDNPIFTLDRQHGYGWYSTEDGQLEAYPREDFNEATRTQSRALDGSVKTVLWASRYDAQATFGFLTAQNTWTQGKGYGDAPVYPYEYNQGLEAWWEAVKDGTQFRFYERDTPAARAVDGVEHGVNDLNSSTSLRDSGKSWQDNIWQNMLVVFDRTSTRTYRLFINSNDTNTLTVATEPNGFGWDTSASAPFTIYDARYQTYVIDDPQARRFEPTEIPNLNRYQIDIPMLRYVP